LLLYLSELVDRDGGIQHRKIESLVVDDCAEPAPCETWQFMNDLLRFKTASGEPHTRERTVVFQGYSLQACSKRL